jgi:hypothetical protein
MLTSCESDLRVLFRKDDVPVFPAWVSVTHDPVEQDLGRVEVLHVDQLRQPLELTFRHSKVITATCCTAAPKNSRHSTRVGTDRSSPGRLREINTFSSNLHSVLEHSTFAVCAKSLLLGALQYYSQPAMSICSHIYGISNFLYRFSSTFLSVSESTKLAPHALYLSNKATH